MRRRRLLGAAAAGLHGVWVAGCTDDGSVPTEDPGGEDDDDGTLPGDSPTGTDATESASPAGALDRREANVTGVEVEARDGGAYRFSVTLLHDDDGEDGYANWWQVETLDGDRLGRRALAHAHGTQEFTRSETVEVPSAVDRVAVRGHDQTHGYGGQAALVALDSGAVALVGQGRDPEDFDASDCPE